MGLTLRLFCLAALIVSLGAPPPVRASRPASMSHYAVILVLDGARPDYFRSAPMPHLQWLLRHGVQYTEAFVGQEMASTPPSHATIGTGTFPKHHGVQGFVWTDPRTGLMTRPADTQPLLAGALEQVMTEHPVPSIAARVKEADSRARVLAVSGHKCYAADAMGTPAADYILCALIYHNRWVAQAVGRHRPPPGAINNPLWDVPIPPPSSGFAPAVEQWQLGTEDDWTVRYALWAFRRVHYPRVMMINLPETDVIGHFEPSAGRDEATLMERFNASLGQIIEAYREAGILQRTDFVVTADHGMTRIDRRLPFHVLDEAIQAAGATKVYI
ncbi:MAG: alkaline phosphatase family protein, partial [Chloroflexi bacterium]|nr:alkaline phosphatase family protein [Chloroflexota bacterium]